MSNGAYEVGHAIDNRYIIIREGTEHHGQIIGKSPGWLLAHKDMGSNFGSIKSVTDIYDILFIRTVLIKELKEAE